MGFVQTHFIVLAGDVGVSRLAAASLMSVMGIGSLVGGLALGIVSDRIGRRIPLSAAYAFRAAGFGAWLFAPLTAHALMVLAIGVGLVGLSWGATSSLTTAACADVWGSRSAGGIAGLALFIMWIGHAAGGYVPGLVHDATGAYTLQLLFCQLLTLLAAVAIFAVRAPGLRRHALVTAGHEAV
jgi:MFS transporter, OFA family, oxalate/formate antiporter